MMWEVSKCMFSFNFSTNENWIGLSDDNSETNFKWLDGSSLSGWTIWDGQSVGVTVLNPSGKLQYTAHVQSSLKKVHNDLPQFSRGPWVTDQIFSSDPGPWSLTLDHVPKIKETSEKLCFFWERV